MMRHALKIALTGAAALLAAAAYAQPQRVTLQDLFDALVPRDTTLGETSTCSGSAERSRQHECCRIKVVVDESGKATSAKANCTHAPLVPAVVQCQLETVHEQRSSADGKREGYTFTFTQIELARAPRNRDDLTAMSDAADKRCDLIKDPD